MYLSIEDGSCACIYDPSVGRFISEDPIGFESGDYNLYRYTSNNPVNLTDPTGEKSYPPSFEYNPHRSECNASTFQNAKSCASNIGTIGLICRGAAAAGCGAASLGSGGVAFGVCFKSTNAAISVLQTTAIATCIDSKRNDLQKTCE